MSMTEQYSTMIDWAAKYRRMGKHVELGVEIDGQQSAHIFSLEAEMSKRGDWYTFARQKGVDKDDTKKGILSRKAGADKISRFRVAVNNYILTQKMWFPQHLKETTDMKEFIEQIKGATHEAFTRADDGPDLISMIQHIRTVLPTEAVRGAVGSIVEEVNEWEDDTDYWGERTKSEKYTGGSTVF
jgi:hypothetical protein